MAEQQLVDNEYVSVWVDPEKQLIRHKFHKFVHGEAFREALNVGAEAMEKHLCTKWLSDDRNNSALPQEDATWAETEWNPRVLKAGWKFWAVVLPTKIVGKLNMERFVAGALGRGLVVQVFTGFEPALAWLDAQK